MIRSEKHLKAVLGYSFDDLDAMCNNIASYYYCYHKREKKKNGAIKKRVITPSKSKLKLIQARIKSRILDKLLIPAYVTGGVKGKNNVQNAKMHKGKPKKFSMDLKDFFPYVNNQMVYSMFICEGFSADVAAILTRLTTYQGHLPQGSPTSPGIANLVFLPADQQIKEKLLGRNIQYSRFVDDLNFSSDEEFKDLVPQILAIVTSAGFKISHKKTMYKTGKIEITGAKIGQNGLSATKKILEKINDPKTNPKSLAGLKSYIERLKKA